MKAYIIKVETSGAVGVEPFNADKSLEQLQGIVGGYIEPFAVSGALRKYDFYCDEEGKLKSLPVNAIATLLYRHDYICGNVAICAHNADGETRGLCDEECAEVLDIIAKVNR